ncbi:MAG: glycerol-3-phosphate 1-O-acyltransferase PlsY [Burkholderiaceae bacterium]
MTSVIAVLLAYLLGSVSFAVIVSRVFGLADPRSFGSGNPGATNVLRTGNKAAAVLTLLGDLLKGLVAVLLAQYFAREFGLTKVDIGLVALAVFLGHLFPVFHRFQGGKGVATAAGVLFGLNFWLGLATLTTWAIIAFFFRVSSLAALISAIFAPLYYTFLFGLNFTGLIVLAISLLLVWRHRANISKLIEGKESRIGGNKPAAAGTKSSAKNRAKRQRKSA